MHTTTETPPRARRLIVTAREARALREGATQVRRVIDVPEWATACGFSAFTPPGNVCVRGSHPDFIGGESFVRAPFVAGGVYWIAETFHQCPHCEPMVAYRAPLSPKCRAHGWRSAATMPGWASRMSVVVDAVRVERVQEAGEVDALAEVPGGWVRDERCETALDMLRICWDAEHPRAPWASNGWVAVGSVRRIG